MLQRAGEHWTVTIALPAGVTGWFVNVHTGPLIGSSDDQEHASAR
ncbi:MAG: hypothetical protein Q7S40_24245 [Opitutaceae bacterium]|nr:hypothetical protein [Opitutaceae bacterium]